MGVVITGFGCSFYSCGARLFIREFHGRWDIT